MTFLSGRNRDFSNGQRQSAGCASGRGTFPQRDGIARLRSRAPHWPHRAENNHQTGKEARDPARPALVRHWTLSEAELTAVARRRRDRNRLGYALQLCALRYPGRLLRPGELIPAEAMRFLADQLAARASQLRQLLDEARAPCPLGTTHTTRRNDARTVLIRLRHYHAIDPQQLDFELIAIPL